MLDGRPILLPLYGLDLLLLAECVARDTSLGGRNAILATRDLDDFDGCGVRVINSWQSVHI